VAQKLIIIGFPSLLIFEVLKILPSIVLTSIDGIVLPEFCIKLTVVINNVITQIEIIDFLIIILNISYKNKSAGWGCSNNKPNC
jgi:hypothetical protein